MPRKSRENPAIRDFILRQVAANPGTIASLAAAKFGITRAAVAGYLRRLVAEGLLLSEGKTRARTYARKPIAQIGFKVKLSHDMAEDAVWRIRVAPHLTGVTRNVLDICQYGFTEILNNCGDHSEGKSARIEVTRYFDEINILIADDGVGIFNKIRRDFNLLDPRHALLELSKGRLTSDAKRHAGEGIFFSSRMFNSFSILSGGLFYVRTMMFGSDWLIETGDEAKTTDGTWVRMVISTAAEWTTREVFDKFQTPGAISFRKTHVPVKLGRYPGEQLVSRSQAKRILARFSEFSEVMLDFEGIDQIGQAFADEIFRVFPLQHPDVSVVSLNESPDVRRMIEHVRAPNRLAVPSRPEHS